MQKESIHSIVVQVRDQVVFSNLDCDASTGRENRHLFRDANEDTSRRVATCSEPNFRCARQRTETDFHVIGRVFVVICPCSHRANHRHDVIFSIGVT